MTVPSAPVTIGITVTFMFQSFFLVPYTYSGTYLSFNLWSARTAKPTILQVFFLFDPFVCQNPRGVCVCVCVWLSRIDIGLCMYHLFILSNRNFLHNSQWIIIPTQSCLVLFSFFVNLLHSLIMLLIVSSLSPHNFDLLFCCVLSILALMFLIAFICAAIRRDSISLSRFHFLRHVHVFH